MRILLLGGSGQVGHEIIRLSAQSGITCVAPSSSEVNIADEQAVLACIEKSLPLDFVVNASAYTAVDKAESEEELAYRVNATGPSVLAKACNDKDIPLIHISTDYVFAGKADTPYTETSAVNPLTVYGASKLAGEKAVMDSMTDYIILRTSWVYSSHGNNFVKTMLRLGAERDALSIIDDQTGCPTSAENIATVILGLINSISTSSQPEWGLYHYSDKTVTTWFGFAREIFECASELDDGYTSPTLSPITTEEYPTPAKRPLYSVLDCVKLLKDYGITQQPLRKSLQKVVTQLKNSLTTSA